MTWLGRGGGVARDRRPPLGGAAGGFGHHGVAQEDHGQGDGKPGEDLGDGHDGVGAHRGHREEGGAPARAAAQGPLALRGVKMADRGSFATVWFGMEEVGALVISSL